MEGAAAKAKKKHKNKIGIYLHCINWIIIGIIFYMWLGNFLMLRLAGVVWKEGM